MIKILMTGVLLSGVLFAQDIYATFNVNAVQTANLVLSSNGLIKKINVSVGDSVKKGELLLELDSEDLKASVLLAKKKIELSELNLKYAKKAYERFSKVKDVVDEEKFDTYTSNYERSKIELSNAKANLVYKKALLEKTRLKAPFAGIIIKKTAEEGDGVSSAMMSTLLTLINKDTQILGISVDEKYWKKVKLGQTFTYTIDGSKKEFSGKISKIYPAVDSKRRALFLEVKTRGLKVGLFGHGYLKVN